MRKSIRNTTSAIIVISVITIIIFQVFMPDHQVRASVPVIEYQDLVKPSSQSRKMDALRTSMIELVKFSQYIKDSIQEEVNRVYITNETPVNETMYVDTYLVNIREEPSTDADVVDKLQYQSEVQVLAHVETSANEEWVQVSTPYTSGYISKEYVTHESPTIFMGNFIITYYCSCEKCCDIANRPTASGVMPTTGRTVAADKSIPFGTRLIIDGHEYVVEDRGGKINGNHIDIYCGSHEEALSYKSKTVEVYTKVV